MKPAFEDRIYLTKAEQQSNLSRQRHAELLISQLPKDHDGRNTWLLNYGVGEEAQAVRDKRGLKFCHGTTSCETVRSHQ